MNIRATSVHYEMLRKTLLIHCIIFSSLVSSSRQCNKDGVLQTAIVQTLLMVRPKDIVSYKITFCYQQRGALWVEEFIFKRIQTVMLADVEDKKM